MSLAAVVDEGQERLDKVQSEPILAELFQYGNHIHEQELFENTISDSLLHAKSLAASKYDPGMIMAYEHFHRNTHQWQTGIFNGWEQTLKGTSAVARPPSLPTTDDHWQASIEFIAQQPQTVINILTCQI